MKLIDRYIAKTVLSSISLVTLMLVGLQIFILFVNQLDIIGRGQFTIVETFIFVLLQVPYQVYLFFPVACLLGCLIGLGILANNSELIVIRASGVSIGQIILAVLKAAIVLIVTVTLLGETLIPKMVHYSEDRKVMLLSGGQSLRTQQGVWVRRGDNFINIGLVMPSRQLKNIYQYRFNAHHQLVLARHIDEASYVDGRWQLSNVKDTVLSNSKMIAKQTASMSWDIDLQPDILTVSRNEPDEMTLGELKKFIDIQHRSHQRVASYELAYWSRLIQPLSSCVMMFLAIPFIFGPLRTATMGSRLLAGATVGFGFHILNKFFGPVSQVYQIQPLFSAVAPTVLFALLAFFMMRRVR